MSKRWIKAGATDQTVDIFVADSSSVTGAGLSGLVYNSSGLACYYRKGATGSATALTLATLATIGTAHADGGFKEVDATNMKGVYRLDLSDTIVASAGMVTVYLFGAANMVPVVLEIEVVSVDIYSATAFITGINSLAPPTNWNLLSIDGSGRVDASKLAGQTITAAAGVTFPSSVASPTNITAGTITTATNVTTVNGLANNVITANSINTGAITNAKFAAGAIDASAIATDAIGSDELAATAANKVAGAVFAVDMTGVFVASSFGEYINSIYSGANNLIARLGAFTGTGINTVLGFLRALAAKAAALTPSDLSSGTTYDNTTDSQEALRDNTGTAGAGLTGVVWNAAWDAEVQSEVQDAIEVNHLDHLLAVDYDPASKPGTATALMNELVESDGGVSRYTANALEQAPSGGGGGGGGGGSIIE